MKTTYKIKDNIKKIDGMFDTALQKELIETLIIPKNVLIIENGCLSNFPNLKNIYIEDGNENLVIEQGCFKYCTNLVNIDFGNRPIEIEANCFSGHNIKKLILGNNILKLGTNSFLPSKLDEEKYIILKDSSIYDKLKLKRFEILFTIKELEQLKLDEIIELGYSMKDLNNLYKNKKAKTSKEI